MWEQTEFIHKCPASTAWEEELFYSNMYNPNYVAKWIDTDTPKNAIFKNDKIEYSFNEYGFRSDYFYQRSDINILVSGCSLTVGIGVEYQRSWPQLLKKLIEEHTKKEVTVWNIATSGASGDYVSRTIYKVFGILKPHHVFIYWPSETRLELPDLTNETRISQFLISDKTFPKQLANEKYLESNQIKNKNLIERIKYSKITGTRIRTLFENKNDIFFNTYARDGQHPGEDWHERVAQMFFHQWLTK